MSSPRERVIIAAVAAWFVEAVVTIAGDFSVAGMVIVASFAAFSAKPSFATLAALDTIIPIVITTTIIRGDFSVACFAALATIVIDTIVPLISTTGASLGIPSILLEPPKIPCVQSRQRAQTRLLIIIHIAIIV